MNAHNLLDRYDVYLLDVDGVLVRGSEPIPGSIQAVSELASYGQVLILTNNSTLSRRQTAERLAGLGYCFEAQQVVASSYVACRHLVEQHGEQEVWVLGEEGIREEARLAGHRIVNRPEDAGWIIAGMKRDLCYGDLSAAWRAYEAGAKLVATNTDATFPAPGGFLPGAGAIIGALNGMGIPTEAIAGKPEPLAYHIALEGLASPTDRVLMVGDRLETDILGAHRAEIDGLVVLSGVTTRQTAETSPIRATWVAADLAAAVEGRAKQLA